MVYVRTVGIGLNHGLLSSLVRKGETRQHWLVGGGKTFHVIDQEPYSRGVS